MRLMSSTWRTIVAVHWSKTSRSVVITLPYLRRMRSAESWIGVSGFLISCAIRRATSAQAEVRCAETRSVMSSSVTTNALVLAAGLLARDADVERPLPAVAGDLDLLLHEALPRPLRLVARERAISGRTAAIGRPRRSPRACPEQRLGRRVDDGDHAARIEADHAGRDAGQDRLREAPAPVDEVARGGQAVVLAAQLGRHLVEGLAEMGEVALRPPNRHLDVEIAGRDLVGRVDQAADRRDEPVGEVEAEPDRREEDDQRDQREHGREGDLDADLLLLPEPGSRRRRPRPWAGTRCARGSTGRATNSMRP